MAIKKCKVCGKVNPIKEDGICWNCYYADYCAWSRGPEERITYEDAINMKNEQIKIKAQIELDKLSKRDYSKPLFMFLGKQYPLLNHPKAPKGYVWHHTYYDYDDPEAGIVLIAKGYHTMGHNILRELGISIRKINFPKE